MHKARTLFTTIICLLIIPLFFNHQPALAADGVYKLGMILPLTGPGASIGTFAKRSIELAYAALPPLEQSKLQLYFEDDSMDPKKAISAFNRLIATHAIDGVICMTSGTGHAIAPLAEKQKKLTMVIAASDKTVAAGKDFVFLHWVSPEVEAKRMVDEIKKRGYQRIAVVSHMQQGVEAFMNAAYERMQQEGLSNRIVSKNTLPMGTQDFSPVVTKLRTVNPDSIMLVIFSDELAAISKRIRELHVSGEIFGAETFEDEHIIKAAHGALDGTWFVNGADASRSFVSSYQAAYHEFPGIGASNAYDALNLFAEGVKTFGVNNQKITEFLRTLHEYAGASGTYSASGDNRFTLPAAVKVVKPDGFEVIH